MPYQPVLGQIMPFGGTTIPRGWALCNGALLSIQQNSALFSLLGTMYGGNGQTNFALPNLSGRAILGASSATGGVPPGAVSGFTSVTLTAAQMPAHNHVIEATLTQGTGRGLPPADNVLGTNTLPGDDPKKIFVAPSGSDTPLALGTNISTVGGNQAHNNMQPYLVISYLIAMQGTYPSRS